MKKNANKDDKALGYGLTTPRKKMAFFSGAVICGAWCTEHNQLLPGQEALTSTSVLTLAQECGIKFPPPGWESRHRQYLRMCSPSWLSAQWAKFRGKRKDGAR